MTQETPAQNVTAHLPLRPVEFLSLAVLKDAPMHGYGIVQQIDERTAGQVRVRPGDLYRVLYRLSNRGLIQETAVRHDADRGTERRAYYRITPLGLDVARAEATLLSKIAAGVMGGSEIKIS